jgi:hypothetical protein
MSNASVRVFETTNRGINPALPPVTGLAVYVGAAAIALLRESDQPAEHGPREWAISLMIAAIAAGIAFAVSRRAVERGPESMSRTALILGVVAAVTMVVFWAGLPCVFGATAVGLGISSRSAGGRPGTSGIVGIVLGGLALIGGALILLSGG